MPYYNLAELGLAVAARRKLLGMKQEEVARLARIAPATLSRLERGHLVEFGVRKLINVLSVIGLDIELVLWKPRGDLDELLIEHSQPRTKH